MIFYMLQLTPWLGLVGTFDMVMFNEIIINGLNIFIPWIGNLDVYLLTGILLIPEIKLCVLWASFWKMCQLTPVSPTEEWMDNPKTKRT